MPGIDGPGGSFGLPEGLSIPVTAKHKAAAAAFIEWWERPENAIAIYKTQGSLPCGATALKQLADSGQLQGGDVVSAELPHVGPLFPGGAPIWYAQFSSDAQGLLNSAVKGDTSVADALNQLQREDRRPQPVVPMPWNRGGDSTARETQILGWLFVAPAMILVIVLVLYPMVHGFQQSIESGGFLFGEKPGYVGLRNYRDVLNDPVSREAMVHTLWYVLLAVSLEMVLGIFVAVTLHRVFPGRGFVLAVLILPWALPSVVSGVLWRRVFDPDNGLLNALLLQLHIISHPHVWLASGRGAIVWITLVHVWGVLPLVSLIFLAGLQSIPDEVYSASAVDGAGPLRQFRHITLPLLRPSMAIALTVGTLLAIAIFDEIYVLNGTALNTRSILIQVYNTTFAQADFAHGTALAFLLAGLTAVLGVLYALALRRSTV